MKHFITIITLFVASTLQTYGQAEKYNLESKKLHKKVRKTIENYFKYDKESGGFVKTSVKIDRFNEDGNLVETYSLYNSKYSESNPVKKLYYYNSEGLLLSTKDISDQRGKYSTELIFTYDNKENLIKKESVYKDGSKLYTIYVNDRKGRVTNKKEYNKENKLTSDTNYSYDGKNRTEKRTSFNSKDGSIIGTYTSYFDNDLVTLYKSNSKYGDTSTSYTYDKKNNLISTNYSGKTNSKTKYNYVYDKKDNWIKKHYRSGKYQYFYFREIHFDNGDVTGSADFDKQFVNSLGNFVNVEVVPLKKKTKNNTTNTSKTNNSSYLNHKTWDFDYVYVKEEVKKLAGSVELKNLSNGNLKVNSDASITVKFSGKTFNFYLKVSAYKELDDKYQWVLKNDKNESGLIWIYKKTKPLKDSKTGALFDANGIFSMKENNSNMSFYLK